MSLSANALLAAAQKAKPTSSLALLPIKGLLDLGGKGLERLGVKGAAGAGERIIQKGIVDPLSRGVDKIDEIIGKPLGEIPGVEYLFRRNIGADDIAHAAKTLNLSPAQVGELTTQSIKPGAALFTHRLSAPLESSGFRNVVLPIAAGAYVMDMAQATPESRAREALSLQYKKQVQEASKERKKKVEHYLGLSEDESIPTKHAAHAKELNAMDKIAEQKMKEAADHIKKSASIIRKLAEEKKELSAELKFYKEAVELSMEGTLSPENIPKYVERRMQGAVVQSPSVSMSPSDDAEAYASASGKEKEKPVQQEKKAALADMFERSSQNDAGLGSVASFNHGSRSVGDDRISRGAVSPKAAYANFVFSGNHDNF